MMAGIFAVFSLAIAAIIARARTIGMVLAGLGIALSLWMFWFHITDVLKINW